MDASKPSCSQGSEFSLLKDCKYHFQLGKALGLSLGRLSTPKAKPIAIHMNPPRDCVWFHDVQVSIGRSRHLIALDRPLPGVSWYP